MQRRECLALLAGMASLPLWMPACSLRDDLTIGLHAWPGYEPLVLARHFGWLPGGVALDHSANAGESLAKLHSGELDGAALTLDEVLKARAEGRLLAATGALNEIMVDTGLLEAPDRLDDLMEDRYLPKRAVT